jgi:hypothetical protein
MEKHLERALIELQYAVAEFGQNRCCVLCPLDSPKGGAIEMLFVSLRLARWGLDSALSALREIQAAEPSAN